jgi:hypothetical protein
MSCNSYGIKALDQKSRAITGLDERVTEGSIPVAHPKRAVPTTGPHRLPSRTVLC